ncbi:hypothetical protein MKW98_018892 [Papaver atlanticum]|uniref:Histone deacetylase interacting domain-containing protein n=1 Tax=Papaver atlanticum TaxID=357466 RepID=A0AAD4TKJ8_9MAGN|nr:hypothetical protein MKW98_018892 [Papaver atlanticum]
MKTTTPRKEVCNDFVQVVKQSPKYNQFLHLMKNFWSKEEHNRNAVSFVSKRVKQIFEGHSELASKFKTFVHDPYEDTTIAVEGDSGDDEEPLHLEYSFYEKAMQLLRSPNEYKQFLKFLYLYSEKIISKDELQDLTGFTWTKNEDTCETTKSAENRPDKRGDCEKHEREKCQGFEASTSKRRRLIEEPKSMLERLLEFKGENPSYKESTRTNNQISLFASGISTYPDDDEVPHYEPKKNTETSSEYFRHSIYEEQMFKCEDERVERDILLNTIQGVEELVAKIDDSNTIKVGSHIRIEDHLSVPHLGCIKRLFGKSGLDVMDSFLDNAIIVLPLILTRLHQKQQEKMNIISSSNSSFKQQNTTSSSNKGEASTSCAIL